MNELDSLLRATVADLAAESRPRDLMPGVQARARRIRTVHRTGYLAAALLVVVALLVPYLLARPAHRVEPGPAPAPSRVLPTASGRHDPVIRLPGGWVVTAKNHTGTGEPQAHAQVLDRRTQRYQELTVPTALPAPTGTQVLIGYLTGGGWALFDLATGDTRPLNIALRDTSPEWSPDARRIVFTDPETQAFDIVDVASGTVTQHGTDQSKYPLGTFFTWYPDGTQVVAALIDTSVPANEALPDVERGLQLFDADTGTPGQLLPVHGIVYGVAAWSPDRTKVLVEGTTSRGTNRKRATQVIQVSTGHVTTLLQNVVPQGGGWVDNDRVFVAGTAGLCAVRVASPFTEADCAKPADAYDPTVELLYGPG